MQIPSLILWALPLISLVAADGLSDLRRLRMMAYNASSQIDNSILRINNTVAFPNSSTSQGSETANQTYSIAYGKDFATSSTIQALIDTVGAATTNLVNGSFDEWQNKQANSTLSAAYSEYIKEIPELAQALTSRGRAWHNEANQPVYLVIQSLAQAVHSFSYALASRWVINQFAIIGTLRAGSNLIDAQTAWSGTGSLPGKLRLARAAATHK